MYGVVNIIPLSVVQDLLSMLNVAVIHHCHAS